MCTGLQKAKHRVKRGMGVHSLMRLVQKHGYQALSAATIDEYRGTTLAIDANICVYKAMAKRPLYRGRHIVRLLRLAAWMRRRQINAVFVFDGHDPLQVKQKTLGTRRERKRRNLVRYTDTRRGIVVLERMLQFEPLLLDLLHLVLASARNQIDRNNGARSPTKVTNADVQRQRDRLVDVVQRMADDIVCCYLPRQIADAYCHRLLSRERCDAPNRHRFDILRCVRCVLQRVSVMCLNKNVWFFIDQMQRESWDDYCLRIGLLLQVIETNSCQASAAAFTEPLCIGIRCSGTPQNSLVATVNRIWQAVANREHSTERQGKSRCVLPMLFCVYRDNTPVSSAAFDEQTTYESHTATHRARCVAPTSHDDMQRVEMRLRIETALLKQHLFPGASIDACDAAQEGTEESAGQLSAQNSSLAQCSVHETLTLSQSLHEADNALLCATPSTMLRHSTPSLDDTAAAVVRQITVNARSVDKAQRRHRSTARDTPKRDNVEQVVDQRQS